MLTWKKKLRTASMIQADSNFIACWHGPDVYSLSLSTGKTIYIILISGGSDTHHILILSIIISSSGFGQPLESGSYKHLCQFSILNPFSLKFNNSLLVKCSLYRSGVAQNVGRGIALLFHDRGTRRGWVVSSTLRPHFTPGRDTVPALQEAVWPQGRSGRVENLIPTGIRSRTLQPVVIRYTDWATRPIISPNENHLSRHVSVFIALHFTRILKCSFPFGPLARVAHRLNEVSFY